MSAVAAKRGPIVAIDGPAGAGKSTVAAHLARRFGLLNLETGAMYRALALKCARKSVNVDDAAAVTVQTENTRIELQPTEQGNRVLLDGEDVTAQLRTPEITALASRVSVHGSVRQWMVAQQRAMGLASPVGVVMEGRDIGTVVFPDADVKIFLDASAEVRGDRRFVQQGGASEESREQTLREVKERDARDRSRAESPLRPAEDAIIVDTTGMSLDDVLKRAEEIVTNHS
ncbi:MAG: (d)CMP kinase [Acidobacteria bacterium]|nr:(d)CMP kinase [Acidobacteriota bacterium]